MCQARMAPTAYWACALQVLFRYWTLRHDSWVPNLHLPVLAHSMNRVFCQVLSLKAPSLTPYFQTISQFYWPYLQSPSGIWPLLTTPTGPGEPLTRFTTKPPDLVLPLTNPRILFTLENLNQVRTALGSRPSGGHPISGGVKVHIHTRLQAFLSSYHLPCLALAVLQPPPLLTSQASWFLPT